MSAKIFCNYIHFVKYTSVLFLKNIFHFIFSSTCPKFAPTPFIPTSEFFAALGVSRMFALEVEKACAVGVPTILWLLKPIDFML